ncbi:MAG: urea ABC transporter ATP-binding subunit UrtE [Rhizobiaceae bacterium]|nr:urea ABC transporter ATP-binding subunit UrtE [Rhizobiaceae bacterium]
MAVLEIDKIDLHYGAAQILHQVSVSADEASITCIMGRNGVGKTSLLKAITGHHPISNGDIVLNGDKFGKAAPHMRASKGIAYVPQGRDIFPMLTVQENLETGFSLLPKNERNIPDYIFELFPVLKQMLSRRGGDLSGGQQQQLAIGRALVTKPKVLVLDEPTEGIQPSVIKDIGRAIEFLRDEQGLAIVLVEQYLQFCRQVASKVYIMDRGAVVHEGPAESLDQSEVRAHLTV